MPNSEFEEEIRRVINRHCMENESGTPDYILARMLTDTLTIFNVALQARTQWRGESSELPALQRQDNPDA